MQGKVNKGFVQHIHLIFGPTASGKSARAIEQARTRRGVIINADATQLYADLQILSARPTPEEMQGLPHRLYGVLTGNSPASAASWLALVKTEIETAWAAGNLPILCGGTGLYLKALQEGLSPVPSVAPEIRAQAQLIPNSDIHSQLQEVDPVSAARLKPGDTQRLRRAYEVWLATGKPLTYWQAQPKQPPFPHAGFRVETLNPPRDELYARCDARFLAMLEKGAVEEVKSLLHKNYPSTAPVMKAVGVPEISAYLRGELSLEEATAKAQQATRNYAKRQVTWLNNQIIGK